MISYYLIVREIYTGAAHYYLYTFILFIASARMTNARSLCTHNNSLRCFPPQLDFPDLVRSRNTNRTYSSRTKKNKYWLLVANLKFRPDSVSANDTAIRTRSVRSEITRRDCIPYQIVGWTDASVLYFRALSAMIVWCVCVSVRRLPSFFADGNGPSGPLAPMYLQRKKKKFIAENPGHLY